MPEFIEAGGEKIGRGKQQTVSIPLAKVPTHDTIDLVLKIFRAKKEGPVLLLTGGMHGDEINGVEIVRRLISQKLAMPEAGTVIAMPLVNTFGFNQQKRGLPDGKDINRNFPGSKNGSLARIIAHTLNKNILPQIDYGIDFHTGGQSHKNYPHIRCEFNKNRSNALAHAFSPPLIVNSSYIDQSFRQTAQDKDKTVLLYESGESNRLYGKGIKEGIDGTLRLMKYLNMRSKVPKNNKTKYYDNSTWIRANSSGIFHTKTNLGAAVIKNKTLGYISDPYGEKRTEIKSSTNGRIIGLNKASVVYKGDALIHVAYNDK